jgi:hypothetical protein
MQQLKELEQFNPFYKKYKEKQTNCFLLKVWLYNRYVRGDQEGLFKLVTLNCILNRITGVTFGC